MYHSARSATAQPSLPHRRLEAPHLRHMDDGIPIAVDFPFEAWAPLEAGSPQPREDGAHEAGEHDARAQILQS